MGLILWIDQNTFAATLVEKVFKKKDLPFYGLTKVDDFAYLVDDLKPEAIVLDAATAVGNLAIFKAQYDASLTLQNTPFILIGTDDSLSFVQKKVGVIERPFEPFELPQKISAILNKLS